MNTHTLLTILASVFSFGLHAQTTLVSGRVTDARNRAMQGVSISLVDTYDGATTDSSGSFRFSTTESGKWKIIASYTGFKKWEQDVELNGKEVVLNIELREKPDELTAVIITAGSFEASDEKRITVLKPLDIVTTASANADVASAMRTLPGTQQIGESAELFVRGGEGYETKQYIDGMVVANPFFSTSPDLASRGRFSPFLFKGTLFSTGGYSALYGQALSSALILESIDLPDRSEASASISPIFGGGQYQHLAQNKKSSFGASAGYTNLSLYFNLVKQRPDFFKVPEVWNADANFRVKTSSTGMLKMYASFTQNRIGVRNPDIDRIDLKNAFTVGNDNLYTNMSYRERISNRMKLIAGISLSYNVDDLQQEVLDANNEPAAGNLPFFIKNKNFNLSNKGLLVQARAVFDYKLIGLSALRFGAEHWYSRDRTGFNQFKPIALNDHYSAVFAESDIYLSNKLALRTGLRGEHSSLLNRTNIAPRASLAYQFTKRAQISGDYGIYYQKPQTQFLQFERDLPQMRADHYILTYQRINTLTTLRLQAFHKEYKQLQKTGLDTNATGSGYARGIELFWRDKKTLKNFDYWVTYSWLDTKRNYLNFPYELQPNFAANHTANLVLKRFFPKINTQFNLNYQFATGRPFYDIAFDQGSEKYIVRDEGKTIPYNNLSFSINYLTSIKKAFAVVVLSISNLTNSQQIFGYRYSLDGANRVPVLPPARQFIFAGVFLSWGTDRRQDAINNNL
jgi:hypothetical protein